MQHLGTFTWLFSSAALAEAHTWAAAILVDEFDASTLKSTLERIQAANRGGACFDFQGV